MFPTHSRRRPSAPRTVATIGLAAAAALAAGCGAGSSDGTVRAAGPSAPAPAPVEVAAVERGPIALLRVFSGTLEASAEVQVSPRIAGHLERLAVDIGDRVTRGTVIAWLDDDELQQAVAQSEADLAVARATLSEAQASAELSARELERLTKLRDDGITSESSIDSARTAAVARDAMVTVGEARVQRAEAALEAARLRLEQTRIVADWDEPPSTLDDGPAEPEAARVVAERFVDEGVVVGISTPLVSIVSLTPMIAVVFVPERDYSRLQVGQQASLTTDAYPGETFVGRVARIAPVFRRTTRQVRVELEIENADQRLKPGMFVRALLELAREDEVTVVPYAALTTRGDVTGLFVLPPSSDVVRWTPVETGIREGDRIQVSSAGVVGHVVTLGQELCDDGTRVTTPDRTSAVGLGAQAP
ncbi:MAG: efflux RND transporter periplasmic adaptor subunit [Planctomycetota bacterium]